MCIRDSPTDGQDALFSPSALLITQTVSCTTHVLSPEMSIPSATTAIPVTEYLIWCKGCQSIQRFSSFLSPVDSTCYRVHVQCRRCLQKSTENYRKHREDIKAARLAREQVHERVACVCGVTIHVRYRDKHCKSKRHLTVVAPVSYTHLTLPTIRLV